MTTPDTADAGSFTVWLGEIGRSLTDGATSNVPCQTCTACCRASQFIHIEPDETAALNRIPSELLFPAPGLADGHVLMGYDRHGSCPMLRDDQCSIYDDRPRACRVYDCRIFAASGVLPDEPTKAGVAARVERWEFTFDTDYAQLQQQAISAAAHYLGIHSREVSETASADAMRDSLVALRIFEHFVAGDSIVEPSLDTVRSAVQRLRRPHN